jgi:crossover junction endodeoxyribonuclease RusA
VLILTMPWPILKPLSPNWRGHWAQKAKAKRQLREAWFYQALEQGAQKIKADALTVSLEFHMPDKRARDLDNLLASCKAGLDGLADALGVDDSKWSLSICKAPTHGGFVRVTVVEGAVRVLKSLEQA